MRSTNFINLRTQRTGLSLHFFVLLLVLFTQEVFAADFAGSLKGVTITDDAGTNKPPVAVMNYTQNAGTFLFDAKGSSDSDGTIVDYKWDFGDGVSGTGSAVSHQYNGSGIFAVTLSVIDNNNGVGLTQKSISLSGDIFSDTFSSDTSGNYTTIEGGLTVSGGAAHGKSWARTVAYHNTSLGAADHWVEADVTNGGANDNAGILARVDSTNKTGYAAYFSGGKITLGRFSGSTHTWLTRFDGATFTPGTYSVRVVVAGSSIKVYVNGVMTISTNDSTYTTGKNVGVYLYRGGTNTLDVTVDNIRGGV